MKPIKIVFAGLVFLLVACNTDEGDDPRSVTNNKYENTAIGLSLQFPAGWQIKTDHKYGSYTFDIAALAPPINNFSANVLVGIESHQGTTNMAEIVPQIKAQLQIRYPDMQKYKDTIITVDGKQVGEISYVTAVSGVSYHGKTVLVVNKGKDVSIQYTDIADRYEANQEFKTIQASMHLN